MRAARPGSEQPVRTRITVKKLPPALSQLLLAVDEAVQAAAEQVRAGTAEGEGDQHRGHAVRRATEGHWNVLSGLEELLPVDGLQARGVARGGVGSKSGTTIIASANTSSAQDLVAQRSTPRAVATQSARGRQRAAGDTRHSRRQRPLRGASARSGHRGRSHTRRRPGVTDDGEWAQPAGGQHALHRVGEEVCREHPLPAEHAAGERRADSHKSSVPVRHEIAMSHTTSTQRSPRARRGAKTPEAAAAASDATRHHKYQPSAGWPALGRAARPSPPQRGRPQRAHNTQP